jgi:hypothetical protein
MSDSAIALSYFAIPITMAIVLRHRRDDIPYPWLWSLFVAFIVACGLTHVVHVWSAFSGNDNIGVYVTIAAMTAFASTGTAVAYAAVLPQIKDIPSPRAQRASLEELVAKRTAEKDRLIREINHRVGNHLKIVSSLIRIERRTAQTQEADSILARLEDEVTKLNNLHHEHSMGDFLAEVGPQTTKDTISTGPSSSLGTAVASSRSVTA